MVRRGLSFVLLLVVAAWAGAQGRPGLSAAQQLHLLRADRAVIGNLIDDGLGLARADAPLARVEGCRRTARTLADALGRAVSDREADRIAELGSHLETVVRDALVPQLQQARGLIPDDSPEAARLKELQTQSQADLETACQAIPATGPLGEHHRVRETRGKLDQLRSHLK